MIYKNAVMYAIIRRFTQVFGAVIPFILLHISTIIFSDIYLLGWMTRHWYCGLWIIVIIVAIKNFKAALVISLSNVLAILTGQFIGDIIRNINISKITPETSVVIASQLRTHYGVVIWMFSLMLYYILIELCYLIYNEVKNSKAKNLTDNDK